MAKYDYDVVMSPGHGLLIRGAKHYLDEVNEARKVVAEVSKQFKALGGKIKTWQDDVSTTQTNNVNKIVSVHNSYSRDYDVSVHFNAAFVTTKEMGVEVLYLTPAQKGPAAQISKAIAKATGLPDRGAKYRNNLGFLNNTTRPALLIEVCFVDSKADEKAYKDNFTKVCKAIAEELADITNVKIVKPSEPAKKPTKPSKPKEPAKKPVADTSKYYILSGTYDTKADAVAAAKKMVSNKLIWVYEVQASGKKYVVKTGAFTKKADAESALASMKAKKILWYGDVKKA